MQVMPFFEYQGVIHVSNIRRLVLTEFQWHTDTAALNMHSKYI